MEPKKYISFNQDIHNAMKEQQHWESKGYLVTDTYWNTFDCGQVLEFPHSGNDVLKKHKEHMERCGFAVR